MLAALHNGTVPRAEARRGTAFTRGRRVLAETMIRDLHAPGAPSPASFGRKAATLARLHAMGAPTMPGFAISAEAAARFADEPPARVLGGELDAALARLGDEALLAVRASPAERAWGGPHAVLDIGAGAGRLDALAARLGLRAALDARRRLIQGYAVGAMGADADAFEAALHDALKDAGAADEAELDAAALERLCARFLEIVEDETGAPFPEDPRAQLEGALQAMARAWASVSARLLRVSRGGPERGGLALIVQSMAMGLGEGLSGAGRAGFRDPNTGAPLLTGRMLWQAQGDDALSGARAPVLVGREERIAAGAAAPSLEETAPQIADALRALAERVEHELGDAHDLEFTIENGALRILSAEPMRRAPRAAVRIAVDLAQGGAIGRRAALLRIEPRMLNELLHPTLAPDAPRDVIARGLPASPGAASGPLAFSAEAAEAFAARGARAILVRVETSPEDIRGMHAAAGVLTLRGGMTSHAAVVARGLGVPAVVGASELSIDRARRVLRAPDGRVFAEGDMLTVDGGAGQAMAGAAATVQPEFSGPLAQLMAWADEERRMKVRANADTAQDARVALGFAADGIGLCRTEHMFFERGRINVMRRMILAQSDEDRRAALERLLPMQRADFAELYRVMRGRPMTIRLLDPPLHEFLPHGEEEIADLAREMGVSAEELARRIADMQEFNPMLGKRGCRLGVTLPDIYRMQARAIFEALAETWDGDQIVDPEIMIPLVSARREAQLIRGHIDEVAAEVARETGRAPRYRVGVMVETPRAALRAGDLARDVDFLSFGTNDLTQMTYGLSRDDAGRFMRDYVNAGVFPEDPFHTLDLEGVGELMLIAVERARAADGAVSIGLCGEHGGDPASVRFCELAGFDYVSCSPFRVPVARLAAAQAAILARDDEAAEGAAGAREDEAAQ
ncbi:pyruvate phosphate dikinase [Oceanicella actignis]|nr:pyruvate phosphate dikinase [Oceanicella actignis]